MTFETEIVVDDLQDLRDGLGDSRGVERALERFLDSSAMVAQSFAQLNAPKDQRGLVSEIGRVGADRQASGAVQARVGVGPVEHLPGGGSGPLREGQENYPLAVHEGTGIYGALHRPIRPRRAKAMRFYGRAGLVVALSVRGQKPQPYIGDAFEEVQPYISAGLAGLVRDIIDDRW